MKDLIHRNTLRLATFLAVMAGLVLASGAFAFAEEHEHELSGDVKDFDEFVTEHQTEGIDDIYEYTDKGANHLADALKELLPDDADTQKQAVDNWEDRLGVLSNGDREQYPALTRQLFDEAASILTDIQENFYPGLTEEASAVTRAAEDISPETEITIQAQGVQNFFVASRDAVVGMDRAAQPEPVTQGEVDLRLAAFPGELAEEYEAADDDEGFMDTVRDTFDWSDDDSDAPRQVRRFTSFVRDSEEEAFEEASEFATDAAEHFHSAMEALLDDKDDTIAMQLSQYEDSVDNLKDAEEDQYSANLVNALSQGTQTLSAIQEAFYPGQESQVREVESLLEEIDGSKAIEEQRTEVQNYFLQAARTTEAMGIAGPAEEPQVRHSDEGEIVLVGNYGDNVEAMQREDEEGWDEGVDDDAEGVGEEGEIGGGPVLSQEVQSYLNFTEGLSEDNITEEEVVEGMRSLETAISTLIDHDEPMALRPVQMDEDDTWMDPPGEPADDWGADEPADDWGAEEDTGMTGLQEKQNELSEHVQALSDNVGDEEFSKHMKSAMESASEILADLQTEEFPGLEGAVGEVSSAVDGINEDDAVEDQQEEILSFFNSTASALEAMDQEGMEEEELEPQVLKL